MDTNRKRKKSTRELALEWWKYNKNKGKYILDFFNSKGFHYKVRPLNEGEIEQIYLKEQKEKTLKKLNAVALPSTGWLKEAKERIEKRKREFNPDLFKAYINKFSEEDKLKALKQIALEINTTNTTLNTILNDLCRVV